MRTFLSIVLLLIAVSSSAQPKNIPAPGEKVQSFEVGDNKMYHKGWIDFNKNGVKDIYEDSSKPIDERVENLLSQMTLEEKSCQMATLYGTGRILAEAEPSPKWKKRVWKDGIANIDEELNGVGRALKAHRDKILSYTNHVASLNKIQRWFVEETRLGIPVEFTNEGIHGLNHSRATPLPAPIAVGSTWNRALVREAGEIAGHEAKVLGYHSVYAPILDVARDPRWGRTLECYGEDPYHVGVLGVEMEAAALYCNAARAGKKALCICTVSDSLVTGEACSAEQRQTSFTNMKEIAFDII